MSGPTADGLQSADVDRRLEAALERHKLGDVEHAYRTYREVLDRHPRHPKALHYLGLVAQQAGHSTEAEKLLRLSIESDPGDPRAHNHLGQVMIALGRRDRAVECFENALKVDPRHVDSLNNLANVLKTVDLRRAIGLYRRALELDPRAGHALYNLANALKEDHAYDEALALYERAIEADPDHYHAHHNIGVLLEQKGRFDEAADHYRAARRASPREVSTLANLIAIRGYEPDAEAIADAEASVDARATSAEDRIKLHRGLGKHHDAEGRHDDAFRHFAAAKAILRKRAGPYDDRATATRFDRLIEAFPRERFAAPAPGASHSGRPVFIVGMPRSGTTLTEQILASHPQVFGAGELQDMTRIARSLRPGYPANVASLDAKAIAGLAADYLARLDALAPSTALRVTDKLPVNFLHLGLIATLFPNARIVHCRRDPMDVGLSCFIEQFRMENDFTTDLLDFGRHYLQYARLMAHWRAVLPAMFELRYEDLVADPETQSRALVAHCGLAWDPACLAFPDADRAVLTPSRWQVRQPIYRSSVGRWRHYATQLEPLRQLLESEGLVDAP